MTLPWSWQSFPAVALPAPSLLPAGEARARTLTAVPEDEVITPPPDFSGACITRTFGHAVFDTLPYRASLRGVIPSVVPVSWNIEKD